MVNTVIFKDMLFDKS